MISCSSPTHGRYSNDIALVKLRRKGNGNGIDFSANVAPACLPRSHTYFHPETECIIAGWGKTDAAKGTPNSRCLKSATVPLIPPTNCRRMYANSNKKIVDGMTCAGYETGGVDTCKGDSGGPLACKADGE